MFKTLRNTNVNYGAFVIIATVLVSGCSVAPHRMDSGSLDYYVVDCKQKAQQLAFVNSQRMSRGQKVTASLENTFMPWRALTNQTVFQKNAEVGSGKQDWQLNQILHELSRCP